MGDELAALLLSRRLDDDDITVALGDDKDHAREHDFISSLLEHGGAGVSYPNPLEHGAGASASAAGGLIDADAQVWAEGGEGGAEDDTGEKTAKGAKGGDDFKRGSSHCAQTSGERGSGSAHCDVDSALHEMSVFNLVSTVVQLLFHKIPQ